MIYNYEMTLCVNNIAKKPENVDFKAGVNGHFLEQKCEPLAQSF